MNNGCKNALRTKALMGMSLIAPMALADNSLNQRDDINSDVNLRQKAEMQVTPGFVEGSSFRGLLRNYYQSRDNHEPGSRDPKEWVQGVFLSFRSGYTDTPIGVGLDVHGFYGLKLDGGDGSGGVLAMPLNSKGEPESEFSAAGAAVKFRGLGSLMIAGDQIVENPVAGGGMGRVFPQTLRGISLRNYSVENLTLDAGWVDAFRLRNQSGRSDLTSNYGSRNKAGELADTESSSLSWLGASYSAPQSFSLQLYTGRFSDIWQQSYAGISWPLQLTPQWSLTPFANLYHTRDTGSSQLGRIDNDTYSGGLTVAGHGHSLTFSVQKVDGNTPFDYLSQYDRTFLYLPNSQQYSDFNAPGELSWKLQYAANLGFIGAPDFQFTASYARGEADLTKVDPNSKGYGYIYNADGKDGKHWERDLGLRYAVPSGKAKGLTVTARWATHRNGQGYTASGNTRGNADADEYRVVVDYPFSIF
ncbi:porin [Pseudomonas sp. TTU2014-080ASC]|uniref:OprD family outer membrane porin n=2 Tax=Pseudomonas sp. TTU2014-080ASC TaxID=1729724 RepID=UPI00071857EC|nr:OprD family outer membrane porin [Pseudomonas sp. TTU2014-080ASC]KRW61669.1 porin [Pseudomonas sp. TTU2014-080ASC]